MMTAIYLLIGLATGILIGSLHAHRQAAGRQQADEAARRKEWETKENALREQLHRAERARDVAEDRYAREQEYGRKMREELEKQQETKGRLVQEEIRTMTEKLLKESREELFRADKDGIERVLQPLKERIETFAKAVNDSNRDNATHKAEIKTAFEQAMKRLHDEQQQTVRELKEQTERIGSNADNLTKALKGDSKLRGDWGEMILEKTLEDCGLQKDEQFFLQQNVKAEDGRNYRPDAVVSFPNGEKVVIDAKVSLVAYLEATGTDDADRHERLIKEHVASVHRHIDELSQKGYEKLVKGSIGYVLMFIPYESGYAAAIKADASLLQSAYRKNIIIISPANLLMALKLTHTMWQNYRVNKNVEEILRQSNDLYDKFVGFAETFLKIGTDIDHLRQNFDKAHNQLADGKGNIVRRLDAIRQLGITPKKEIPDSL